MQFEMSVVFLGCNSVQVEGKTYCSLFTGQNPVGDAAQNTHGFEVTKITAEAVVFEQIGNLAPKPGDDIKVICLLKKAANNKTQPHIIGLVPGAPRVVEKPTEKKAG